MDGDGRPWALPDSGKGDKFSVMGRLEALPQMVDIRGARMVVAAGPAGGAGLWVNGRKRCRVLIH